MKTNPITTLHTVSCPLLVTALCLPLLAGSAMAADVVANWTKHCVACHAKDGSGSTRMGKQNGAKDYRDPKVQAELTQENALKALKDGMKHNGKEVMKPFADKLSEEEMKALIAYMRTFKQ